MEKNLRVGATQEEILMPKGIWSTRRVFPCVNRMNEPKKTLVPLDGLSRYPGVATDE